MNKFRIVLNVMLALAMFFSGLYLLGQDSFFLADRWNPEVGTLLEGAALYCLAVGLFLLGGFAGMVAYGWIKGSLTMPDKDTMRPHPSYKGLVIVRYWYWVLPAVVFIMLAFLQAGKAPNPSLQRTSQSCVSGTLHLDSASL
ncbi:hypothetical protein OOT00_09925 [Desulfobotulus sp. H1]|uniref:Uncharacterized protein n=1 Tax=Desulfobotulus pelophilus TaxID=2823377 RepID=A0ABT3NA25_9BACT|nr:hypothetical protein [Desulfobotulus pelophilus]MCW7754304.1 hypothetical protein [Desulfobotulus pelophilus]